jgi:hypothetical protein
MIKLLAVSLVISLLSIAALTFSLVAIDNNSDEIGKVTDRLDIAQTTTRQKVLCPLYEVLISSENPVSRERYPRGPEAYDMIFDILQKSYNFIGCEPTTEGQ